MDSFKSDCFFFHRDVGKEIIASCSKKGILYMQRNDNDCVNCPYYITNNYANEIVEDHIKNNPRD